MPLRGRIASPTSYDTRQQTWEVTSSRLSFIYARSSSSFASFIHFAVCVKFQIWKLIAFFSLGSRARRGPEASTTCYNSYLKFHTFICTLLSSSSASTTFLLKVCWTVVGQQGYNVYFLVVVCLLYYRHTNCNNIWSIVDFHFMLQKAFTTVTLITHPAS